MVLADGKGTPLGVCVEAATPSEVKLLERTLDSVKVKRRRGHRRRPHQPERLIADRGYDSNPARALPVARDIEPIIPKRRNNRKAALQATLDYRAHELVAAKLPAAGGPLRAQG